MHLEGFGAFEKYFFGFYDQNYLGELIERVPESTRMKIIDGRRKKRNIQAGLLGKKP